MNIMLKPVTIIEAQPGIAKSVKIRIIKVVKMPKLDIIIINVQPIKTLTKTISDQRQL